MDAKHYMNRDRRFSTALRPGLGLGLLVSIFLFMLIVVSVVSQLILAKTGATTQALRIQAVLQDVLVFILPAVATAMLVTRLPAEFLEVMRFPRPTTSLLAVATLLASVPVMNVIISWNASWNLPESMAWMREMEEAATTTLRTMMGEPTTLNLIMSLLIIGVLTGVAEEMFFRGGIQKLLMCTRVSPHAAIWITAVVFSAFHVQVLGFVPRILLGAFFGYLMWWSGSLWLPILIHAVNNSIVVIGQWVAARDNTANAIDSIGTDPSQLWLAIVSAVATIALLVILRKSTNQLTQDNA